MNDGPDRENVQVPKRTNTTEPRGRPRRRSSTSGDTRRDILVAAGELFDAYGVERTTMSAIAQAAGISQSSAYYWFSGKEAVLAAMAEDNRASLKVAREQSVRDAPASHRLYQVVYADITQMLGVTLPFYELERAAESSPEAFPSFTEDYAELRRLLATIIADGIASGEFTSTTAEHGASAVLALSEGLQHRHGPAVGPAAEEAAHLGADMAVRMLTAGPEASAGARLAFERAD